MNISNDRKNRCLPFLLRSILRIGLALSILTLVFSGPAGAVGGITMNGYRPHFATQENKRDFIDLQVKVLGGEVAIKRRWVGDRWEWNSPWNDIEVNYPKPWLQEGQPVAVSSGSGSSSGSLSIDNPYFTPYVVRNGQTYILPPAYYRNFSSGGGSVGILPEPIYENGIKLTFKQAGDHSWTWRDRRGNLIHYNRYGQMDYYEDRNNVRVTVERNPAGNITRILDHFGTEVITFTWEDIPGAAPVKSKQGEDVFPQRPIQLQDYSGRTVVYHWGAENRLDSVVDVRGKTWTYQYSGSGLLSGQTDPMGRVTTFSIGADGKIASMINADGAGERYSFSYDADKEEYYFATTDGSGRIVERWLNSYGWETRVDLDGETQFTAEVILSNAKKGTTDFVGRYQVRSSGSGSGGGSIRLPPDTSPIYIKTRIVTDARGNKTTYTYDQWQNITRIDHPDGSAVSYTYNLDFSLPLTITDERGMITEYQYDGRGNLLALIEAKGTTVERTTRFTYDAYGQVETVTTGESAADDTALATTTRKYDSYGNLTRFIDPYNNNIELSDHDALGYPHTITDARGKVWNYTFDAAGNLLTQHNPYDQGITYSYNKAGDLVRKVDTNGAVTTIDVNASGLPLTITDDSDQTTTLEFDKGNRLTALIDANNHSMRLAYDGQSRIRSLTDGEDNTTQFNYKGTLLDTIQYPTFEETLAYDNRNRLRRSTQQANNTTYLRQMGYDLADNVTSRTDANGLSESFGYDQLNRLVRHVDADGGVTLFEYDARDNLVKVTDPEQRVTHYTYTLRDELETETKQDYLNTDRQFVYAYDESGNLSSRRTPENEWIRYSYDDADRLAQMQLFAQQGDADPIKVTTYRYNDVDQYSGYDQVIGAGDNANPTPDILPLSESYTYNNLNQRESVTVDFGDFQKSYRYTYYPNGLKKTYTNPEGITYTYFYTQHNELAAVLIPGEGQIGFGDFDWMMPKTLLLPGGSRVTLTYDQLQQVKTRLLTDPADTELARALYQYDLENNITQIDENYGALSFGYDNLYRLIDADYPWSASEVPNLKEDENFGYDGVGNRTSEGPGSAAELSDSEQVAQTTTFTYDNHNRLKTSSDGAVFTYNTNGHTTRKVHNDVTTDYIYNREERLIEVRIDGVIVGQYTYNPYGQRVRKIANGQATWYLYNDEGLAAEYDNNGNLIKEYQFKPYGTWMTDPLFQRTASGEVYYYQNDHLGTPQRMLNKNGAVVWEARYEAFGKADVITETIENNLRFPGQYYDQETEYHQNWHRYYDPKLGRYLTSDRLGLFDGPNTYAYAYQNPLIFTDPTGQFVPVVIGAIRIASLIWRATRAIRATALPSALTGFAINAGITGTATYLQCQNASQAVIAGFNSGGIGALVGAVGGPVTAAAANSGKLGNVVALVGGGLLGGGSAVASQVGTNVSSGQPWNSNINVHSIAGAAAAGAATTILPGTNNIRSVIVGSTIGSTAENGFGALGSYQQ